MKKLKKTLLPDDYTAFLVEVKERIRSAQYAALRAVNKELVGLYWDMGMRQFFLEYQGLEKLHPLVGEIAWAHDLAIVRTYTLGAVAIM